MITQLHTTLYESIKDKEQFELTVAMAVHAALKDLGDQVHDLDWANISIERADQEKAA